MKLKKPEVGPLIGGILITLIAGPLVAIVSGALVGAAWRVWQWAL